jgi:hypothetical protein
LRDTRYGVNGNANITCMHYWMIEPHHGPTSFGSCHFCGTKREFINYLENQPAVLTLKRDKSGDRQYKYLVEA